MVNLLNLTNLIFVRAQVTEFEYLHYSIYNFFNTGIRTLSLIYSVVKNIHMHSNECGFLFLSPTLNNWNIYN